jgi:serine phosphatase RsbU (regulator of sigma subunit)
LQTIVQEQLSSNWSAQALIDRLYDAVTTYVNGAEQFDDLTLLAVKAL